MTPDLLLIIIKLAFLSIIAFLAILILSKVRSAAWSFIIAGVILCYAAVVFDLMILLGIATHTALCFAGIPFSKLICIALPGLCFVTGFILKLCDK